MGLDVAERGRGVNGPRTSAGPMRGIGHCVSSSLLFPQDRLVSLEVLFCRHPTRRMAGELIMETT